VSRGLSSFLARLLGLASTICSLLVIAGFILFVVNQSKAASARQQAVLNGTGDGTGSNGTAQRGAASTGAEAEEHGALQGAIHSAAKALRSPFASLTSSSHSRWTVEIVGTLLALLLYGFILRYLMRMLTMRVRT